jgi:hypothetical protein
MNQPLNWIQCRCYQRCAPPHNAIILGSGTHLFINHTIRTSVDACEIISKKIERQKATLFLFISTFCFDSTPFCPCQVSYA